MLDPDFKPVDWTSPLPDDIDLNTIKLKKMPVMVGLVTREFGKNLMWEG